jgi:2-dehydropantoate 2-reductase
MRIAVVGAGATGGYVAGKLAKAGHNVSVVDIGEHLAAIRRHGLRVKSHWGDFTVNVPATDDPAEIGPVNLVQLAVKTYHNEVVLPRVKPLLGDGTVVLTLQNGVDNVRNIAKHVGIKRIIPGAFYIETTIEEPGVIRQQGDVVRVVIGEADGKDTPRVRAVAEAFNKAGIQTEVTLDIQKELWTKFLFVVTLAGVTSACRALLKDIVSIPEVRELIHTVMLEVEAVARARGVALDKDVVKNATAYFERSAADLLASMHMDLEHGRPMELEALTGAVVKLGRESNVPTPVNQLLYTVLKPHAQGGGKQEVNPKP